MSFDMLCKYWFIIVFFSSALIQKIGKNEKLYTGKQRNNPTQPKKEIIFFTVLLQVFKCVHTFTDNVFNQESLKDLPGLKNEN